MSKEPLLLPSAKSGVLVRRPTASPLWRIAAIVVGLGVVCVGAVDVFGRLEEKVAAFDLGSIGFLAFAPVAVANDPSLVTRVTGEPAPVVAEPLVPLYVRIPAIGVDALVEAVGKKPNGAMDTPKKFDEVAWYSLGSKPGAAGNAVFAGHVNNALNLDGVFAHLQDVEVGTTIEVEGTHGEVLTYEVVDIQTYKVDEAPLEEIFRITGPSQIVLITCEGEWNSAVRSYDERLVVVAKLLPL